MFKRAAHVQRGGLHCLRHGYLIGSHHDFLVQDYAALGAQVVNSGRQIDRISAVAVGGRDEHVLGDDVFQMELAIGGGSAVAVHEAAADDGAMRMDGKRKRRERKCAQQDCRGLNLHSLPPFAERFSAAPERAFLRAAGTGLCLSNMTGKDSMEPIVLYHNPG